MTKKKAAENQRLLKYLGGAVGTAKLLFPLFLFFSL
jgi:hypothetical protein